MMPEKPEPKVVEELKVLCDRHESTLAAMLAAQDLHERSRLGSELSDIECEQSFLRRELNNSSGEFVDARGAVIRRQRLEASRISKYRHCPLGYLFDLGYGELWRCDGCGVIVAQEERSLRWCKFTGNECVTEFDTEDRRGAWDYVGGPEPPQTWGIDDEEESE